MVANGEDLSPALQPVRASYDALAPTYDKRWQSYIDASLSKALSILTLNGDERILDVACGTGELEQRLLARWPNLRITGVDFSPQMLAHARQKPMAGQVVWMEGESANMPVRDGEFDFLFCANSFHYFPDPLASLREFQRCLRPNGTLILLDWCDDFWSCKLCNLWLRLTDATFVCTYTTRDCRRLLADSRFEILRSERFKISWLWGMMLFECKKCNS